jgi:hypothetical protein
MEFATEMIIKSSLHGAKIAEVPITLHPDGRKSHAPHLKTFRDGWRTLRFFLMCSPKWLFFLPGILLLLLGLFFGALAFPNVKIGPATFDAHTLLFASLFLILGYQAVVFAIMTKAFAVSEGILPKDIRLLGFFSIATLERGLVLGALAMILGLSMLGISVFNWSEVGFGVLDYSKTMRWVIPGAALTALGFQTILFSFFISMMGINRK